MNLLTPALIRYLQTHRYCAGKRGFEDDKPDWLCLQGAHGPLEQTDVPINNENTALAGLRVEGRVGGLGEHRGLSLPSHWPRCVPKTAGCNTSQMNMKGTRAPSDNRQDELVPVMN